MAKQAENVPVKREEVTRAAAHPLMSLRDDIDRMFDNFMRGTWPSMGRWFDFEPFRGVGRTVFALAPSVDVCETDNSYEITAELPGMSEKDIELTLTENVLTLKGEKKEEREEKKKDYYLSERSYGSFQRSFTMPSDANAEKITTSFKNGVLSISIPKSEEAKAKTRKIEVKTA
jgi:HSP20 family protein